MEQSSEQKLETYLFQYKALGKSWGLDIPAYSPEEAKHRVAAISDTATYDGVLNPSSRPAFITARITRPTSIPCCGEAYTRSCRSVNDLVVDARGMAISEGDRHPNMMKFVEGCGIIGLVLPDRRVRVIWEGRRRTAK